ncbi:MAG: acyltransferase, partial [Thiohalomonadales bacterium]|nr:acyltransferase [Thiohalomonadales bacterium]
MTKTPSSGIWSTARTLAEQTPPTRNRYVDFLRAVSICVVVFGHWLVGLPAIIDGALVDVEVMRVVPWTQWLSWAMQVMPVFFVVGGFSNSVSWRSAQRKGLGYGNWAASRMQRLVGPLVPLLLFWTVFALSLRQLGIEHQQMRGASMTALLPVWFLAVYILVTAVTPITHAFYLRIGVASFWVFALGAALFDLIAYVVEQPALRWANYGFVWLAVHQLGFMWQDNRLGGVRQALLLAVGGLGLLILLITVFGYPLSMLTVPGQEFSNSRPPSLALLALGIFHMGLLLALQAPARRWLQRPGPWTLTVLVNSRIMTLYLWHLTVMVLLVALARHFNTFGLALLPGDAGWWPVRLMWLVVMFAVLQVFVALLGRFEQPARRKAAGSLSTWRVVSGTVLLSLGLALVVTGGISAEGS